MKVACIGNMNNSFFSLVRYLRDNKIDADLLLTGEEPTHFMPFADTYDESYKTFTRRLKWGNALCFLTATKAQISEELKGYDFLLASGHAPSFITKGKRRVDIFVPYGWDIYELPFFRCNSLVGLASALVYARHQFKGIQEARFINYDITNEQEEETLVRLNIEERRLKFASPFLYTPAFNPLSIQQSYARSPWYERFARIRKEHDLVIFHHARLCWKHPPNRFSYKGNNKLIEGFADFLKQTSSVKACLILFEYGNDVKATKELVASLGIEKRIFWFPKLWRKDLMVGISLCDIGAGEFGISWLSYGVICEFMAMAKPVLHTRDDSLYIKAYPELYPMIHAESAKEISEALIAFVNKKDFYGEMGQKAKVWFQKYGIDNPIGQYLKIIRASSEADKVLS